MRNKIMLTLATVGMIYGASTLLLALLPPLTLAGGDDLSVSAIDASGCIVPDSESIKVDQWSQQQASPRVRFQLLSILPGIYLRASEVLRAQCRHYSTVAMTFPSVLPHWTVIWLKEK